MARTKKNNIADVNETAIQPTKDTKLNAKEEVKEEVLEVKASESKATKAQAKTTKKVAKAKATTKEAKSEPKATAKKATKAVAKTTKKVAAEAKKDEKAEVKAEEKMAANVEEKVEAKTETKAKKMTKKEKKEIYETLSMQEGMARMSQMGVNLSFDDYRKLFLDADAKELSKKIVEDHQLKDKDFTYENNGFDVDLVEVVLKKIEEKIEVKKSDFKTIKKNMDTCIESTLSEDHGENEKLFDVAASTAEKILMIAQRKNIEQTSEITALLDEDVEVFMNQFFTISYAVLPTHDYSQIGAYEDFAYAILSQFKDLFYTQNQRIMMDVADLYIKKGNEALGDQCYNYILRENKIKDYVYYRYANVFVDRNLDKAKGIANWALQSIGSNFVYHEKLVEILYR